MKSLASVWTCAWSLTERWSHPGMASIGLVHQFFSRKHLTWRHAGCFPLNRGLSTIVAMRTLPPITRYTTNTSCDFARALQWLLLGRWSKRTCAWENQYHTHPICSPSHPPPRVKITCADHHDPVFLTHTDLTQLEERDREREEVEMAAGVKKKVWCWNCLVMVGSIFKHTSPFSIFSLQLLQIDRELLAFSIMYSPVFWSSSPAASTFGLSSLSGTMSCTACSSVPSPPSNKV